MSNDRRYIFPREDIWQRFSAVWRQVGGELASRVLQRCILSSIAGLLPHGQLDPPLWSQRGIGRIFPWPHKSRRRPLPSLLEAATSDELPIDYVFRVVNKGNTDEFCMIIWLRSRTLLSINVFLLYCSGKSSNSGAGTDEPTLPGAAKQLFDERKQRLLQQKSFDRCNVYRQSKRE